jgi:hypothetical protein
LFWFHASTAARFFHRQTHSALTAEQAEKHKKANISCNQAIFIAQTPLRLLPSIFVGKLEEINFSEKRLCL